MLSETPNLICSGVPELPSPGVSATRSSRRRTIFVVVVVCIIALFLASIPLAQGAYVIASSGRDARDRAAEISRGLREGRYEEAVSSLASVRADLERAREGVRLTRGWRYVPIIGVHLRSLDQALEAAVVGSRAADHVITAFSSVDTAIRRVAYTRSVVDSGRSFRDFAPDEKRQVLAEVSRALPEVRLAREQALIAIQEWDQIPSDQLISPIRDALEPVTKTLQIFRDRSDEGMSALELALPLIGYPYPRTYLVLLQNAEELRPGGGFIGVIGTIRLDAGSIVQQSFEDVYSFDKKTDKAILGAPPDILKRELGVDAWYLRDRNWSPDAVVNAQELVRLFDAHGWTSASSSLPEGIDGVIVFEPEIFRELLGYTGGIVVDGVTYGQEGFFDQLEYQVEKGFAERGVSVEDRKEIVGRVGQTLLDRLQQAPTRDWGRLTEIILDGLAQKHLLLYLRDPQLQKMVDAREWSGRVVPRSTDSLLVVDANLAALKTDGVMDKRITYALDLSRPDDPRATVTLVYRNTNPQITWRYTRYRDYVRLYVPEGSQLLSSTGAMAQDRSKTGGRVVTGSIDVSQELGRTVFGAFWSIEPGEERTLTFTYRLPQSAVSAYRQTGEYEFYGQKQPGSRARLTLDLRFGKKLLSAVPAEESTQFGDDRYRSSVPLDRDHAIRVRVQGTP